MHASELAHTESNEFARLFFLFSLWTQQNKFKQKGFEARDCGILDAKLRNLYHTNYTDLTVHYSSIQDRPT